MSNSIRETGIELGDIESLALAKAREELGVGMDLLQAHFENKYFHYSLARLAIRLRYVLLEHRKKLSGREDLVWTEAWEKYALPQILKATHMCASALEVLNNLPDSEAKREKKAAIVALRAAILQLILEQELLIPLERQKLSLVLPYEREGTS